MISQSRNSLNYYIHACKINQSKYNCECNYAAFQSPRANGAHDFPSCANRSNHVPTGNFPFAPLEKWRRFFCLSLHRWEKDGVAYQKPLYYRSSTSTLNSAPSYSRITHAPALLVRGFVNRKKGARSMGEEKKEGKNNNN